MFDFSSKGELMFDELFMLYDTVATLFSKLDLVKKPIEEEIEYILQNGKRVLIVTPTLVRHVYLDLHICQLKRSLLNRLNTS